MKTILSNVLPKNKRDIYLYYLMLVAFLPLIYLMIDEKVSYMLLNFICLLLFCILIIFRIVRFILKHQKLTIKSPALLILIFMFSWMFLGGFFSFEKGATWFGMFDGIHQEESIWQYLFYLCVAISAINLKRENIKYLLSVFITVACLIILIQIGFDDYSYGFIHKNHTGYYLCLTLMLSVGMFFFH